MTLVDGASFPWLFLHNNTNKRNHDRSRVRLVYYLLQAAYLIFTSSAARENGRRKGRWRRWWQIEATSANPWAVVHGIVGLSSHPKQKKTENRNRVRQFASVCTLVSLYCCCCWCCLRVACCAKTKILFLRLRSCARAFHFLHPPPSGLILGDVDKILNFFP